MTKPVRSRAARAPKLPISARVLARRVEATPAAPAPPSSAKASDKLSQLEALLRRPEGATLAQSAAALGWVERSVRGAMAGGLKRRGLPVTSTKVDGVRTYRLPPVQAGR